jgi:Fic family protein
MWNWQQKDWPDWKFDSSRMQKLEASFLLGSGLLQGVWKHIAIGDREQVRIDLLSEEAIKTSAIEGEFLDRSSVQSSVMRQFGLVSDRRLGLAESGIAELLVACYHDFADDLTDKKLFGWQQLVCRGRRDLESVGVYRIHPNPMQVISGPLQKPKIHFEAPSSQNVLDEMARFLEWYRITKPGGRTALPALTRAGLAHLYFVSIHPFEDGNGRLARALSEVALAQALGAPSLIALSNQIEKNSRAYYLALENNNKAMDVTEWLLWFGNIVLAAQAHSTATIEHLIFKTQLFDRLRGQLNARQEKVLIRLFDAGPEGFTGGLSAKNYTTITNTTPATARRDLVDLVNKRALNRTGERKGTRYWLQ